MSDKTEQELVIEEVKASLDAKIAEAQKGLLDAAKFETFKTEIQEKLDGLVLAEATKTEIHTKHAELLVELAAQGAEIKALKESSKDLTEAEKKDFNTLSTKEKFRVLMTKAMEGEDFKKWADGDMKGNTSLIDIKAVTGLGSSHTGSIFVTEEVTNIRDINRMQPQMRDHLSVAPTDETNITYPEVYDYNDIYTLGSQMLAENEEISDVSFKSKENTSSVSRLGVSLSVSKRYFRGKSQAIIDHVLNQVPEALGYKETVQILHGDGSGNNIAGIIKDARKFDLTPTNISAGQIASVATYNGGTQALITFTVAHGALGGDTITIASATATGYNIAHKEIIVIDEKSIVINLAYVAEADTSAWTATVSSYWYLSVEGAQEFDVLNAAASVLEAGLYGANAVFVNPQTVRRIGTLKATDASYIGVTRDAAKGLTLDGMPIIPIAAIPAGWFLIGDFSAKSIEIREYSPMRIQFLEDITTTRTNSIVILADEEIHLVKYNPKWYIYDRFSAGKTQLETESA